MWKAAAGQQINLNDQPTEDDEWETDPDFVNDVNEQEQRWGSATIAGSGRTAGAIDMSQLRKETEEADALKKKKQLEEGASNPAFGYGGKFGIEKDRMDQSAVGHEYVAKVEKHASQKDYSAGFGGKFGIQADRVDKPYRDDSEQYSLKKIDTKVWDASKPGRLWNGPGTYEIPVELYAENRKRLIEQIHAKDPGKPVILLQGGDEIPFYDTDITYSVFRQESNFLWTFGVTEPGCFGAIDVATKKTFLFVPRFPTSYLIWRGPLPSLEDISRKYQIPNVHHKDNIASILRNLNPSVLLTLKGVNSDSNLLSREAHFEGIDKFRVNNTVLYNEIANLRVYKTDFELDVMRYVSDISSEAHRKVMRFAKPGKTEYQCEAEFLHYCYATGGCRHTSYTCICASGANGAILHYGHAAAPNNKMIEPGDLCLFDMGANYFGYCADITCTFPANGKFSPSQKLIYEAVLLTNTTVFKSLKPGVSWLEMHTLAHRVLLGELKKGGLLKGDVEAMVAAGLGGVFQPHGLGHLLGLDVHDVGGFIGAKRSDLKGAAMLRTTRELKERMVITVEPGCYFIDVLLDEALESAALSRFLVADVIKRFRGFGGVRIEDNVLITKNGAVSLTKVPRSVKEVEDWIAGKDSKTYH